jgi:dolichol-phosphate mannosyltransferase
MNILVLSSAFSDLVDSSREMFHAAAAGADIVRGSRFSKESVLINYPIQKIRCNRSFHILLKLLFYRRVRDLTDNLKLMRREVADDLDLEAAWFAANAETGLKPLLMGYKVRSVPVSWINRTPEMCQSTFSLFNNGLEYAKALALLAWRTRFGTRPLPRRSRSTAPAADALPTAA